MPSGEKEDGQVKLTTPEKKALHLLDVWLEKDEARRANPCADTKREALFAERALREQAERLKRNKSEP